jgi:hypothetical protein
MPVYRFLFNFIEPERFCLLVLADRFTTAAARESKRPGESAQELPTRPGQVRGSACGDGSKGMPARSPRRKISVWKFFYAQATSNADLTRG